MKQALLLARGEFKVGMMLYRNRSFANSLEKVQRAVELDPKNAHYVSYMGLLVALVQKNYRLAEELCHRALRMNHNEPQLYLNIAEVYLRARNKEDAVEALTVGLQYTKRNLRLTQALRKLGVRRPPVIPFLERKHFLNRHLGKARYRLLRVLGRE
ncbi:MAG: tetratricopeptide repeat protein [Terriglobia bacterium]